MARDKVGLGVWIAAAAVYVTAACADSRDNLKAILVKSRFVQLCQGVALHPNLL